MRTLAALAVLMLAGVASLTYVSWPDLVEGWIDWHRYRAKRRLAAGDFQGAMEDAEFVMKRRPEDREVSGLYGEALIRRLKQGYEIDRLNAAPSCSGGPLPPAAGVPREGGR